MKHLIDKTNRYVQANRQRVNHRYRHTYHLMGEIGWMNDPNGFSMYDGFYHMFFQYHPFDSKWGPMYWGHAVSTDCIRWTHLPVALAPVEHDDDADGGSAFSGSAIEFQDKHYLMYTENWFKRQVQSIAFSQDGVEYIRDSDNPVLTVQDHNEDIKSYDYRDPKLLVYDNDIYVIVSSRSNDQSGQLLLYRSTDLHNWTFVNVVCRSNNQIGEMWECPDLFSLQGRDVLVVSPQYMPAEGNRFNNVHSSIYMVGTMDFTTGVMTYDSVEEIDSGFDFYAPQTVIDDKGRRIMIAWMGMWERTMPTHELGHHWAGSMTLPRELRMIENQLVQLPLEELMNYRVNHHHRIYTVSGDVDTDLSAEVSELDLTITTIDATEFGLCVFASKHEQTVLSYDTRTSTFSLDRSNSGHVIQCLTGREDNSSIRRTTVDLIDHSLRIQLFMDTSSLEVFLQDGRKTMTSVVYPKYQSTGIRLFTTNGSATFHINKWDLEV